MRRRWRWVVVAVGTVALLALPFAAHLLPRGHSAVDAVTLLSRVRSSAGVAYSGYAQAQGGLSLPISTDAFQAADLLTGRTRLRVWWRGADDWRVDSIDATGETDLHHDGGGTWTWDYESDSAQRTAESSAPSVRLPRADDVVPGNLARRLLSQASTSEVSRLPNARIAGREAAGLRVRIAESGSTIEHVDVWALPVDGLVLRAAVYGSAPTAVVSSSLLDVSTSAPAAAATAFQPAPGVQVRTGRFGDIVAAIDQFGRSTPPDSIAGLTRRPGYRLGAVGVYGRGVTLLVALPLSAQLAGTVVPALRKAPGSVENASGIALGAGPINVALSPPTGYGARWLLVGTVTAKTLRAAVPALPPVEGFGFHR